MPSLQWPDIPGHPGSEEDLASYSGKSCSPGQLLEGHQHTTKVLPVGALHETHPVLHEGPHQRL